MVGWMAATCACAAGCSGVLGLERVQAPPDAPTICFSDGFASSVIDPDRWTFSEDGNGTTVAQTGGQLVFTYGQMVSYANIHTAPLDVEDGAIQIQLVQAPNEDGHEETGLQLGPDSDNNYTINTTNGSLNFRERIVGATDDQTSIQYVPSVHHHLRIRHEVAGPTVHFETSPDGIAWDDHRSVPANVPVTAAVITIYAGTFVDPGPASMAVFDDFQMSGRCPPPP